MRIFETVRTHIVVSARNIGNTILMVFGFVLVFFSAYSHSWKSMHSGTSVGGIDVAHAEAPACGGGDSGGCGGGDSGSGGCSGSDSAGSGGASCGCSGE